MKNDEKVKLNLIRINGNAFALSFTPPKNKQKRKNGQRKK